MIIQIDTREQKNSHIEQYFAEHGIKTVRSKMFVGDYMDISNGLLCIDLMKFITALLVHMNASEPNA